MFRIGLNILEMASFFSAWTTIFHVIMFLILAAHDAGTIFDNIRKTCFTLLQSIYLIDISKIEEFLGLFLHLAVVMSFYTQFTFWILFYIDRELILPEIVGVPSTVNHMLHTFPLFLDLIAINIFSYNFPSIKEEKYSRTITQAAGAKFVGLVAFVYLTLIWILFEVKGVWPYPFMFSYTRVEYLIFSLFSFLLSLILCLICSFIEVKIKSCETV